MKTNPRSHDRRRFLQTAAAGAVLGPYALTLATGASAAEVSGAVTTTPSGFPNFEKGEVLRTNGELKANGRFSETARDIPVAGRSDVLVVGGGPAGIGAALAAARAGAKTQLIETAGCLGGVWTAGMLTKIIDGNNKGGI